MSVLDRVDRRCRSEADERALRAAVLAELRSSLPFDAHAWLLTDPETMVGWGPLAEMPLLDDLAAVVRARYLTRVNRWTALPVGEAHSLAARPRTAEDAADPWPGLLAAAGAGDVVTVSIGDRFGTWSFLDLWRIDGTFTSTECRLLGAVACRVAPALRACLAATFRAPSGPRAPEGPAVLLLSDNLRTVTHTPSTEAYLRRLLPTEATRRPVPAAAYNVAAQLLAREAGVDGHPPWARMHLEGASWVTVRAARLLDPTEGGGSIAVSIEPCPAGERTALFARVVGLSARETEVLEQVALGRSNQDVARRLFLSEHTVQDHLKAVFQKTGTNDRRTLAAQATGATGPA